MKPFWKTPTQEQFVTCFEALIKKYDMQIPFRSGFKCRNEFVSFSIGWDETSMLATCTNFADNFEGRIDVLINFLYPSAEQKAPRILRTENYAVDYMSAVCQDIDKYCTFLILGQKNELYDLFKKRSIYQSDLYDFLINNRIFNLKVRFSDPNWPIRSLKELKELGIELPEELKNPPFDV